MQRTAGDNNIHQIRQEEHLHTQSCFYRLFLMFTEHLKDNFSLLMQFFEKVTRLSYIPK